MCCKCACGWKRGKGEGSGDGPPPTRVNTASAKVPAVRMISSRIRRLRLLSSSILMYCSVSSMNSPAHSKPRTRRCPPTLFHTFNYVSTACISVPGFAARSLSRRTLEHLDTTDRTTQCMGFRTTRGVTAAHYWGKRDRAGPEAVSTDGLQLVESAVDPHEVALQQVLHGFQRLSVRLLARHRLCNGSPDGSAIGRWAHHGSGRLDSLSLTLRSRCSRG